jgi:hypothetical protein
VRPLDRDSERYHPTGSMSAEGMGNQLGRPNLDRLAVLVREAVQNSWDARLSSDVPVRFSMHGWTLRQSQLTVLREGVFGSLPIGPSGEVFKEALGETSVRVLLIRDSGTTGLSGPTRADTVPPLNVHTDFVDFVRNVGQAPDKALGAGTYGYGKAVLYRSSELGTICIYTRCRNGGPPESRFIACAWGMHFDVPTGPDRGRYTGRHWWGRQADDGIVDPITGSDADSLAAALGIRPFKGDETGTSVLIVAPALGGRAPEDAMRFVGGCLLWYCWPKMLRDGDREPTMIFALGWEGQEFPLPDPRMTPPFSGYAQARAALALARQGQEVAEPFRLVQVRCGKPARDLGLLVLHRFGWRPRADIQTGNIDPAPYLGPSHHVVLMRNAELVVKYLEGPANPVSEIEYAGVFMPFEDVDGSFAKSEPPTHDDWSPAELDHGNDKTFVNVALRRIKEAVKEFSTPQPLQVHEAQRAPLGGFADFLGGLIPGQDGSGPDIPTPLGLVPRGSGGEGGSREGPQPKPRIRQSGPADLQLQSGTPVLSFPFELKHAVGSKGTRVSAVPRVGILDGSVVESEPPQGAAEPGIIGWQGPDGQLRPGANHVVVEVALGGDWQVLIQALPDAVVGVDLSAEAIR